MPRPLTTDHLREIAESLRDGAKDALGHDYNTDVDRAQAYIYEELADVLEHHAELIEEESDER